MTSRPIARARSSRAHRASIMLRWATTAGQHYRIDGPVVGPLSEVQDNIGVRRCLRNRTRILQVRTDASCVLHGNRVMSGHHRAFLHQQPTYMQARRIANVVAPRLERQAENRDPAIH